MSKGRVQRRRRITALFLEQLGKCHWCQQLMVPPGSYTSKRGCRPPENLCTVEHLTHKFDRKVGEPGQWVAACYACNIARGRARELQCSPEELQRLSNCPQRRSRWENPMKNYVGEALKGLKLER